MGEWDRNKKYPFDDDHAQPYSIRQKTSNAFCTSFDARARPPPTATCAPWDSAPKPSLGYGYSYAIQQFADSLKGDDIKFEDLPHESKLIYIAPRLQRKVDGQVDILWYEKFPAACKEEPTPEIRKQQDAAVAAAQVSVKESFASLPTEAVVSLSLFTFFDLDPFIFRC